MSEHSIRALEERIKALETKLSLPKLMTPAQVAEFLQVSERQFYDWKKAGDSPPAIYWSQRTVRYDRDDVMAWAETKKVGQV
ncbi:MAG: hypothetical protein CL814_10880 [Confluentimicrobium sp.]|uniref:helix-turn-helix transcriptional regulator n=1 Tax=Actibacterium sp. TaxID=1872125 RepID=UPI000C420F40|nr:helix-turn-helix domain-containing protein [Actibacterium sp.]MBC57426.1 hypothetical protein [Actibacterium sp.]|tara:strand:+ start:3611 stop:3856 length:246 start_codon:yes stop_codon:yes gene_type:complete